MENYEELKKNCQDKSWSQEVIELVEAWYQWVSSRYMKEKDVLYAKTNKKYLKELLSSLKNVGEIRIISIEDYLNSEECDPKKVIKQKIKGVYSDGVCFKKVKERWVQDEEGEYIVTLKGFMDSESKTITCFQLGFSEMIETFHHELRHIYQSLTKYNYPNDLPFWKQSDLMLKEGDALYQTFLMFQEFFITYPPYSLPDGEIDINTLYYLCYYLIMLTIPYKAREIWFSEGFYKMCCSLKEEELEEFTYHYVYILVTLMKKNKSTTTEICDSLIYTLSEYCYQEILFPKIEEIAKLNLETKFMVKEIEKMLQEKLDALKIEKEREFILQRELEKEVIYEI